MWTIALPLEIPVSKKKSLSLNLNPFRNAHFQVLNKAKVNFTDLVRSDLKDIPKLSKITLDYILYPQRLCDTNNFCSIVDKFFSDALVECGVIQDDNFKVVIDTRFRFGYVDKNNPRIEVTIHSPDFPVVPPEVIETKTNMKIVTKTTVQVNLTADDFKQAIRNYLLNKEVELAADAELVLETNSDGTYTLNIEQSSVQEDKPKKRKMEPKEAMEALKTEPAPLPVTLPVVGEERGHVDAVTTPAATTPAVTTTLFGGTPKTEAPVAAPTATPEPEKKTSGLFGGTKLETPPGPVVTAPTPEAPKVASLFAGLKRPQN